MTFPHKTTSISFVGKHDHVILPAFLDEGTVDVTDS